LPERRDESDIPQHPPVRQEAAVLLHVAYPPSQQDYRLGSNIILAHFHLAPLRLDQAIETAKERGFARPAFSHQRYGMTSRNVDAHIVERDNAPEVMRDISCS